MGHASRPRRFVGRLAGGKVHEAKFKFNKDDNQSLRLVLNEKLNRPPKDKDFRAFIEAVEVAIARFRAYRQLEKGQSVKRKRRATLKKIRTSTSQLLKGFETIDSDTHRLLEICLQNPMLPIHAQEIKKNRVKDNSTLAMIELARARGNAAQDFTRRLREDLGTLDTVAKLAENILKDTKSNRPTGGKPGEHWRLRMVFDLAWIFFVHLRVDPTTTHRTREGPFLSVLRICLKAAGVKIKDPLKLALPAVRWVKDVAREHLDLHEVNDSIENAIESALTTTNRVRVHKPE